MSVKNGKTSPLNVLDLENYDDFKEFYKKNIENYYNEKIEKQPANNKPVYEQVNEVAEKSNNYNEIETESVNSFDETNEIDEDSLNILSNNNYIKSDIRSKQVIENIANSENNVINASPINDEVYVPEDIIKLYESSSLLDSSIPIVKDFIKSPD